VARGGRRLELLACVGVIVLGALPRLALGGGPGERAALVMAVLLEAGVGLAVWLLRSPRAALVAVVIATLATNLAALPPRGQPPYDDRQALYRTDQSLVIQASGSGQVLPLLVEPHFAGDQPRWRLGATVGGAVVNWDCAWQHGPQRIGLPLPGSATGDALDVRLTLSGAPSRDGDYLLVYSSAAQPRIPRVDTLPTTGPSPTLCALAAG
jgi:hypothetical protein